MSEYHGQASDGSQLYAMRRRDWMAAALCGAIAAAPIIVAVVGWVDHWNASINLLLTISGLGFWRVLWVAWK